MAKYIDPQDGEIIDPQPTTLGGVDYRFGATNPTTGKHYVGLGQDSKAIFTTPEKFRDLYKPAYHKTLIGELPEPVEAPPAEPLLDPSTKYGMAGAVAGGLAGAPLGPLGAAVGSGAGEYIGTTYGYLEEGKSPLDALGTAAADVALGYVTGKVLGPVGRGVARVASKVPAVEQVGGKLADIASNIYEAAPATLGDAVDVLKNKARTLLGIADPTPSDLERVNAVEVVLDRARRGQPLTKTEQKLIEDQQKYFAAGGRIAGVDPDAGGLPPQTLRDLTSSLYPQTPADVDVRMMPDSGGLSARGGIRPFVESDIPTIDMTPGQAARTQTLDESLMLMDPERATDVQAAVDKSIEQYRNVVRSVSPDAPETAGVNVLANRDAVAERVFAQEEAGFAGAAKAMRRALATAEKSSTVRLVSNNLAKMDDVSQAVLTSPDPMIGDLVRGSKSLRHVVSLRDRILRGNAEGMDPMWFAGKRQQIGADLAAARAMPDPDKVEISRLENLYGMLLEVQESFITDDLARASWSQARQNYAKFLQKSKDLDKFVGKAKDKNIVKVLSTNKDATRAYLSMLEDLSNMRGAELGQGLSMIPPEHREDVGRRIAAAALRGEKENLARQFVRQSLEETRPSGEEIVKDANRAISILNSVTPEFRQVLVDTGQADVLVGLGALRNVLEGPYSGTRPNTKVRYEHIMSGGARTIVGTIYDVISGALDKSKVRSIDYPALIAKTRQAVLDAKGSEVDKVHALNLLDKADVLARRAMESGLGGSMGSAEFAAGLPGQAMDLLSSPAEASTLSSMYAEPTASTTAAAAPSLADLARPKPAQKPRKAESLRDLMMTP